jgi:lysosomal acid lipase/cholesteryl ester hydrolase
VTNSKLDINSKAFWDAVDIDHMADEDVPSIVDYVLATTKAPRLHWVGHSQGGGQLVFALSKNPSLAERLGSSVLLAPGVHVAHLHAAFLKFLGLHHVDQLWRNHGFDIPTIATNNFYFPGPGIQKILEFFAAKTPLCRTSVAICNDVLKLIGISVGDPHNLDWRTLADVTAYDPGCSSFHLLMHWAQRVRKDTLRMFDWGEQKNKQHYNGSSVPPLYDLSKITGVHLALFDGDKDIFITPKDMKSLVSEIPKENWIKHTTMHNYAHMDFPWNKNAHVELYPEIISLLSPKMDVPVMV